jgi:hypothetical protein
MSAGGGLPVLRRQAKAVIVLERNDMNYVTYGGVTIGLCLLAWVLMNWYPGIKALRSSKNALHHLSLLFPFVLGWAYGCLTTLGVGGLIGWLSGAFLGIGNWLGDAALFIGVGLDWGKTSSGVYQPLSEAGQGIVLILTVVMVVAVKKKEWYSGDLKWGIWCGICLGTSAGVAGLVAAPMATAVTVAGDAIYGSVGALVGQ